MDRLPHEEIFLDVSCFKAGTFKFEANEHHSDLLAFKSNCASVYDQGKLRLDSRFPPGHEQRRAAYIDQ